MANVSTFSWATTADDIVRTFADKVNERTFLITGASPGSIGSETVLALARHACPAMIILPGRTQSKMTPVIDAIRTLNPSFETVFVELDLSDPKSVKKAAQEILEKPEIKKIDVLINCAGVMACPYEPTAWKTPDGQALDMTFATNHMGHFLLTTMLMDRVRAAAPGARIVNVSSSGHRFSDVRYDDLGLSNGQTYNVWDAYGQSKTANILMAVHLASTIPATEVASLSLHPGSIRSPLQRYMTAETREEALTRKDTCPEWEDSQPKSLQQGAATGLRAALDPSLEAHSGEYLTDCQLYNPAGYAIGKENAERLWKFSEEIVKQSLSP